MRNSFVQTCFCWYQRFLITRIKDRLDATQVFNSTAICFYEVVRETDDQRQAISHSYRFSDFCDVGCPARFLLKLGRRWRTLLQWRRGRDGGPRATIIRREGFSHVWKNTDLTSS